MAKVLTDPINYAAIADAIRAKGGTNESLKPSEMAAAIDAIQTSGGGSSDQPEAAYCTFATTVQETAENRYLTIPTTPGNLVVACIMARSNFTVSDDWTRIFYGAISTNDQFLSIYCKFATSETETIAANNGILDRKGIVMFEAAGLSQFPSCSAPEVVTNYANFSISNSGKVAVFTTFLFSTVSGYNYEADRPCSIISTKYYGRLSAFFPLETGGDLRVTLPGMEGNEDSRSLLVYLDFDGKQLIPYSRSAIS